VVAPHADEQAPADHHGGDQRPEDEVEQVRIVVRVDPGEDLDDDHAEQHDRPDRGAGTA
jgi:hypothetical protein